MKQKLLYIIMFIATLMWSSKVWGQENVSYKTITDFDTSQANGIGTTIFNSKNDLDRISNGVFTSNKVNHVTFSINNLNTYNRNVRLDYSEQSKGATKTSTFSWKADENYSVLVTGISCQIRGYFSWMTYIGASAQFTGGNSVSCETYSTGTGGSKTVSVSNNSGLGTQNILTLTNTSSRHPCTFTLHDIKFTYKVTHKEYLFNFSAEGYKNINAAGNVTATVADSQIQAAIGVNSASTTATFEATANDGYVFAGWGATSDATSYESTDNPYTTPAFSNSTAGSTATKTLYAIFKPVFYFTATADKINGSYGSVNATVTNQVVGNPSDDSKSTEATFTATPNANCTFEGWFSIVGTDTTLVSKYTEYKPEINNTSVGSTANLTLYAWFKANQTLTWTNPSVANIVNGVTTNGAAAATAKSAVSGAATGLAVTYSSSNGDVASVDPTTGDVTGESVPTAPGNIVTITARQAGNDEFNPVEATRQFTVINKYQASFAASGFRSQVGDSCFAYVDDDITITCSDIDGDFSYDSSDSEVVSISKSGNVLTLKALKTGISTITLHQPGAPTNATHYETTKTYIIKVSLVPNSFTVSLSSEDAQIEGIMATARVENTINVAFSNQTNENTLITASITEQSLSSGVNQIVDNETPVITYASGVITACNAGTAKITFTQPATTKYASATSSTYTIKVSKYSNNIIATVTPTEGGVSSTSLKLKYGKKATLSYTYENTAGTAPTVTRTSGSYTTYSAGTITAGNAQGIDIYEIRQAETYKYEAGYASFTIRVNNTDEATGYVLYDDEEHGWSTISSYTTATLSGPADVLSYDAFRWWGGFNQFYVMTSTNNGSSWEQYDNPDLPTSYQHYPNNDLEENVNRIKFETRTGATSEKRVKNILVTRKTYVRESHDTTKDNLGTVLTGNTATSATITVSYSSTNGGNISIRSDNDHFVPSISTISVESNKKATSPGGTEYICGVDGSQTFTVTYTPDPKDLATRDLYTESAVIKIEDLFYSQTITLTATAAKLANTLAVIDAQELKVDDVITGVYSGKNSAADITATFSPEGVATFDVVNNRLTATGAGSTVLTLSQPADNYHYAATKSISINVTKYNQTLTWDNPLDDAARTLEVGDPVLTTNTATASSELTVTYTSSNPSALEVNATTGALTAKAGGANIEITATQVGNYKYNSASITRLFTVIQKEDVTVTTSLLESVTNLFPIGSDDITIRPDATITASALDITGDDGTITSSFASNTFTLHAVKEGTVTLTLTRAADNSYYALNKTYTVQVVKPVLTLDPTAAPVINYSEYSTVTYNGNLKAGYSTIALPFDADVEELVGNDYDSSTDWVAQLSVVTYNVHDGYSLYFSKSNTIVANQPYILHLGSAVNTPVFTNVSVVAAATASQNATKGVNLNKWTMYSNYTPGFDMEGYYGIAGEKIKKGTEGATLSAFRAYIEGPADPSVQVKAAYLDNDEADGILELLKGEGTGTESVYDLQGRQLPRAGRGINIIRNADGSVRKVLRK